MRMKKNVAAAFIMFLTVTTTAFAADAAAPAAPPARKVLNPWMDCGIGAMFFDETKWAAVSSNIIWDLGTTAVSSDYSTQNTCNGKQAKVAQFIGVNYANLEEETVKGDGKHVHAMLEIMGCDASAHANIISAVREDFGSAVRNSAYVQKTTMAKAEDYYNMVQAKVTGAYASQCQAL